MASDVTSTQNDHYIGCDECHQPCMFGDCPEHGPLEWIDDCQVQPKTQARASLPSNLYLIPSAVGQGQMGVFARARIDKRVMFGPFKGQRIPVKEMKFEENSNLMHMWDVLEDGKVSHIIDGTDEQHSNWMRFVNCARDDKEQNLVIMQYRGEIYYKTLSPVEAGSELLVWFQDSCVQRMDSSSQKHQSGHDFVCHACGLIFPGRTFLVRHKSVRCPGISQTSGHADESESQDMGTSIDEESATPSVDQTESSYVIVHIGPNAGDNNITRIETEEDSPYVVVHVQPASSSDKVTNPKRGKRTRLNEKEINSGKKAKLASGRQRSVDNVRKAKQVVSKARRTSSSKVAIARNATAKKSLSSKRTSVMKRKAISTASGSGPLKSRRGTVKKVNKNRTGRNKSIASRKSSSSRPRKVTSSAKKNKNKATEDEVMENKSAKKKEAKGNKNVKSREIKKQSSNLKSTSARKRPGEGMEGTEGVDGSVEKQSPKKTPRKASKPRVTQSDAGSAAAKKPRVIKVPEEKPVITCNICSRNFKWKSQLDYHMRSHAPEKEFKCTFCNKGLSQMSSLKRHLRVHSGEKPYECEECGKRFLEKAKLVLHRRKHAGELPEKKYKCTVCDRGFTLSANMKTHMRTHTGEKPFPCPQCGKAFRRSSDIISHLRSHTGERPYKCSHCPKAFTMISHRNRHEIIHSGEKPFTCDLCGKGFTQPNSVKAHLKVHARKQALLEGDQGDTLQHQRESVESASSEAEKDGLSKTRKEIVHSNGSEQLQVTDTHTKGLGAVGTAVRKSTEVLQSPRTELVQTENLHQGSAHVNDSVQPGILHRDETNFLPLDTAQVVHDEHLLLSNVEVHGITTQEISLRDGTELTTIAAEHLQLSCTNEQFNMVSSQRHAKELLPLPFVTQGDKSIEHVQLELAQNNGQDQVNVDEREDTAPILLAL